MPVDTSAGAPGASSMSFEPTHEVTLLDDRSGERRVVPIRLEGGIAYALDPRGRRYDRGWRFRDGKGWSFPRRSMPDRTTVHDVRHLGRGKFPRDGLPSRPLTIRLNDAERQQWARAAKREGLGFSAWIRKVGNQAAGVSGSAAAKKKRADRTAR